MPPNSIRPLVLPAIRANLALTAVRRNQAIYDYALQMVENGSPGSRPDRTKRRRGRSGGTREAVYGFPEQRRPSGPHLRMHLAVVDASFAPRRTDRRPMLLLPLNGRRQNDEQYRGWGI